jgi:signal transduction histidine kinase
VLINLLSNAGKYGAAPITVVVEPAGDLVAVHVDDSGTGVSADLEDRLFEKFARGHHGPNGPAGTGLGLAIVLGLVQVNAGRVSYRTRPTGGARFTTVWPLAPSSSTVRLPNQPDRPSDQA